ncbi:MAG TPA: hypothetical protein VN811_15815, partial [Thermoanaerobaculia bacterium]|nr:hypothetical protein [Thermoanaerobaculia bacterium]
LTELRGALSSGRFGLVLALLAATTARGETAAIVDLGDQLDPQEAARCGVVLERLLWARPQRLREALAAAEIALGGDFPLVVLELGLPPLPYGSRDEHAWLRLARAARLHRAALLVATPWRITGSAAGEVLALGRRGGVWLGSGSAPRLLAGVEGRLVREKSRRQSEPAAASAGARANAAGMRSFERPPRYAGSSPYADLGLRAPSLLGPLPARGRGEGEQLVPATTRTRKSSFDLGVPRRSNVTAPAASSATIATSKQPQVWPRSRKLAQQQSLLPDALPAYAARTAATRAAAAAPPEPRPFASQL